jgi:hypothetical protein
MKVRVPAERSESRDRHGLERSRVCSAPRSNGCATKPKSCPRRARDTRPLTAKTLSKFIAVRNPWAARADNVQKPNEAPPARY